MSRKSKSVKITAKQRAYLVAVAKDDQSRDVEKCRALIVLLLAEGFKNKDIAHLMEVHENTVVKWRMRWSGDNKAAKVSNAGRSGGRPRHSLTSAVLDRIKVVANEHPPKGRKRWTVRLIARHCNVPVATMQRALVELNLDLMDK